MTSTVQHSRATHINRNFYFYVLAECKEHHLKQNLGMPGKEIIFMNMKIFPKKSGIIFTDTNSGNGVKGFS